MRYSGDMHECDRCGTKSFLTDDSPERADWVDVERITADGQSKKVLFCPSCNALYKDIIASEEQAFNKFMSEGAAK